MAQTDIRNKSAYTLAEAARYLRIAPATLRTWFIGRPSSKSQGSVTATALIQPASAPPPLLSFWNVIEAHVMWSLRTQHGVSMDALRTAIRYSQDTLKIDRPLLSAELRTEAGKLLVERYGQLIELSHSGQIAMRMLFNEHLARVEWDQFKFPVRLYPFTAGGVRRNERPVAIDPQIAFGRPTLAERGVATATIAMRIDAGESPAEIADDYDLTVGDVEEAVLYERAA